MVAQNALLWDGLCGRRAAQESTIFPEKGSQSHIHTRSMSGDFQDQFSRRIETMLLTGESLKLLSDDLPLPDRMTNKVLCDYFSLQLSKTSLYIILTLLTNCQW
jgi:hypothetical protein